ncbi:ABC transporter permease [Tomitella gaofuii]|uniref:ABC transporter permease n=1 Tax=Tomitella gaofuii TaxID=2760083 RepID=UPI0015F8005F|nr:ABC transporter permease [Tomitella gaofuii]
MNAEQQDSPRGDTAHEAPPGTDAPVDLATIAKAMVLPLFFVVMFALCYVSAFHNPAPHDMRLTIVGPGSSAAAVASGLEQGSPGAFDVATSTDLDGALERLADRDVQGVIELGSPVVAHVASGASATVAQTVQSVAAPLAQQTGTTVTVDDIAPVTGGDATGMGLFYFMVVCSIAGYLTVTVLSQLAPNMTLRRQLGILGAMSVALTLIAFAVSSIFTGTYGAGAGGLTALLLIGVLYTFTIGIVAVLLNRLLGQAAIMAVMMVAIFLNFPSAGGAIAPSMLPAAWEAVHSFWIGSGAIQAMQSVIYFGGNGAGHGLLILAGWLAVAAAGLAITVRRTSRHTSDAAGKARAAAAEAPDREPVPVR